MRYIPLTEHEKQLMLKDIGLGSTAELFDDVPKGVRDAAKLSIPNGISEEGVISHMSDLAEQSMVAASFLGGGSYRHFIPSVVDHIAGRSEWYSAYTPYQPEISQGTLQAIYEFQTYVAAITGMEIANASMYDGASALAEAALMACRISKKSGIVTSNLTHPRWREVVKSITKNREIKITETEDEKDGITCLSRLQAAVDDNTAAIIVQSPNFFGNVEDMDSIGELCKSKGILFIAAVAEAASLGLLKPAGDSGADIVVAEGQSLGIPQCFGGPGVGLFATQQKYLRQMPGRLCGKTVDKDGRDGFVLTLSAREQHIRREKATSNICSNQALCALRTTIYLSLLGKTGFHDSALANLNAATAMKQRLTASGKLKATYNHAFFNELIIELPTTAAEAEKACIKQGIIGGLDISRFYQNMKNHMLFTATELTKPEDIEKLAKALGA